MVNSQAFILPLDNVKNNLLQHFFGLNNIVKKIVMSANYENYVRIKITRAVREVHGIWS